MTTPVFIVDAFTNEKFGGNPAAVCLSNKKLSDKQYQKIAVEFNLSETVYPLPLESGDFKNDSRFNLRWFTPKTEVPLCGHATLATAHVLFHHVENVHQKIFFETLSGEVTVEKEAAGQYKINFPLFDLKSVKVPGFENTMMDKFEEMADPSFTAEIVKKMKLDSKLRGAVYAPKPKILVLVLDETLTRNEFGAIDHCADEIHKSDPNGDYLKAVIVTMNPKNSVSQGFVDKDGNPFDYASRYFGPWVGVPEDPATGSSHSYLAELWKNYINKEELYAYQHYPGRGAQFRIRPVGDRVEIVGKAVTMVEGRAHF